MNTRAMALALTGAVVVLCSGSRVAVAAQLFRAVLDGAHAVPPTLSPATGLAEFILNEERTRAAYAISYEGLQGTEMYTHIHQGRPGTEGPLRATLPPGNPKVGIWDLTPTDADALEAGRIYVVVHTDPFVSGEIRGNLTHVNVATEPVSWGWIKSHFR